MLGRREIESHHVFEFLDKVRITRNLEVLHPAPGSFDARRELAIEVHDQHVVPELERVARHDWNHSEPLDLSDQGSLADLEKRGKEASATDLALAVLRTRAPSTGEQHR